MPTTSALKVLDSEALVPPLSGPDPRERPVVPISNRTLIRARAVAEALFSTESGAPSNERMDWLSKDLADFLGRASSGARWLFQACLLTVAWLSPLTVFRLPFFFGSLTLENRRLALSRFERTPLAMTVLACKALLCILYFEHPDVARETGVDPCIGGSR